MTEAIAAEIEYLQDTRRAWGDTNYPLWNLLTAIKDYDVTALKYLVYHIGARALPCWELYCENNRPRYSLYMMKRYLLDELTVHNLEELIEPTKPCVEDCRYSEAMGASEAAAYAAAFMLDEEPLTANMAIGGAECAYDHIWVDSNFQGWFFNWALAACFEKRFMSAEELTHGITDEYALSTLQSLFIEPAQLIRC